MVGGEVVYERDEVLPLITLVSLDVEITRRALHPCQETKRPGNHSELIAESRLRIKGQKKPRWKPRFSFLATQINASRNVSRITPQPATLPPAQRHLLNQLRQLPPHAWTA